MKFNENLWNYTKVNEVSQNSFVYYFDFVQFQCISLTFAFGAFESYLPNFDWFKISKFWNWKWLKLKKSISQLPNFKCRNVFNITKCHFAQCRGANKEDSTLRRGYQKGCMYKCRLLMVLVAEYIFQKRSCKCELSLPCCFFLALSQMAGLIAIVVPFRCKHLFEQT